MSELRKKPEIVVFAEPNGSGKSILTALLKPAMDYVNADEIKKNLKCTDLEAARLAEKQREAHLQSMEDFFMTILRTARSVFYKKRKEESFFNECDDWAKEDIVFLTGDRNAVKRELNSQ